MCGAARPPPACAGGRARLRLARKLGVIIGNGSDVGVFTHGTNARELAWMVKLGMTPTEALERRHLGRCRHSRALGGSGAAQGGMLADVVAVDGDPTADIARSRRWAL